MTPDNFRESVLPALKDAWQQNCFCSNRAFQKLVSFNFDDYGIGPTGLADSEILIDEIIRQNFDKLESANAGGGRVKQSYRCPQCDTTCSEHYREFSINMYQSYVLFNDQPSPSPRALFLVGWFGFKSDEFDKIHDFEKAPSIEQFLQQLIPDEI